MTHDTLLSYLHRYNQNELTLCQAPVVANNVHVIEVQKKATLTPIVSL